MARTGEDWRALARNSDFPELRRKCLPFAARIGYVPHTFLIGQPDEATLGGPETVGLRLPGPVPTYPVKTS